VYRGAIRSFSDGLEIGRKFHVVIESQSAKSGDIKPHKYGYRVKLNIQSPVAVAEIEQRQNKWRLLFAGRSESPSPHLTDTVGEAVKTPP
jgi:hypothetical protein